MLNTFVLLSTVSLLVASLLPFSKSAKWWVRVFEFPRLQLLTWSLINLVLIYFSWSAPVSWLLGLLCAACAACAAYHLKWIYPYFPFHKVEVASAKQIDQSQSLSILSSNVLMTNPHYSELLALIAAEDPDIVITLESDERWQEALDRIEDRYPFSVKAPQDNLYGMHIYSKLPLLSHQLCYLVSDEIPSVHCTVALRSGQEVNLRVLHPMPPSPTESDTSSGRDAELIMIGEKVGEKDVPTIVGGDLNDVAWSETTALFKHVSGLKDPRIGRGFFNTFHARYPIVRWPLDHVFHSSHFELAALKRLYLKGSDHFALYIHLTLRNPMARDETSRSVEEKKLENRRLSEEQVCIADAPDLG